MYERPVLERLELCELDAFSATTHAAAFELITAFFLDRSGGSDPVHPPGLAGGSQAIAVAVLTSRELPACEGGGVIKVLRQQDERSSNPASTTAVKPWVSIRACGVRGDDFYCEEASFFTVYSTLF